jgi:hypothetical protein
LQSQSLNDFLTQLCSEKYHKKFFKKYTDYLQDLNPKFNLLIDNTDLKNVIKLPITTINKHKEVLSNEIQLIVVADKINGVPIFYRYIPDNKIDILALTNIINEIKEYKININKAILDTGYYSEPNIEFLINNNIPFITRLSEKTDIYNLLIKNITSELNKQENIVKYRNKTLFIKKLQKQFGNSSKLLNYYVCRDIERQGLELINYYKHLSDKKTNEEIEYDLARHGIFILVSSVELENINVLPYYYDRENIKQVVDYMTSTIDLIPLRYHQNESLASHFFYKFISINWIFNVREKIKKI